MAGLKMEGIVKWSSLKSQGPMAARCLPEIWEIDIQFSVNSVSGTMFFYCKVVKVSFNLASCRKKFQVFLLLREPVTLKVQWNVSVME